MAARKSTFRTSQTRLGWDGPKPRCLWAWSLPAPAPGPAPSVFSQETCWKPGNFPSATLYKPIKFPLQLRPKPPKNRTQSHSSSSQKNVETDSPLETCHIPFFKQVHLRPNPSRSQKHCHSTALCSSLQLSFWHSKPRGNIPTPSSTLETSLRKHNISRARRTPQIQPKAD